MRARSCLAWLLVLTAIQLAQLPFVVEARAATPRIDDIEQSLNHDPSYRVRVGAALVLGRLRKPRSVPALLNALRDSHPAVRGTAAQALGRIGDPSVRGALERAAQDSSPMVRRMAQSALRALGRARAGAGPNGEAPGGEDDQAAKSAPPPPVRLAFDVKTMGDRSHRASPALRGHMRDYLSEQLRPLGEVSDDDATPARGYVVDGVIKNLSMSTHSNMVEVICAVQLIISRQPTGGVFLLTSGEAIVQKPKHQFKPQQKAGMEIEALENAVRGASEDLVHHLAQQ